MFTIIAAAAAVAAALAALAEVVARALAAAAEDSTSTAPSALSATTTTTTTPETTTTTLASMPDDVLVTIGLWVAAESSLRDLVNLASASQRLHQLLLRKPTNFARVVAIRKDLLLGECPPLGPRLEAQRPSRQNLSRSLLLSLEEIPTPSDRCSLEALPSREIQSPRDLWCVEFFFRGIEKIYRDHPGRFVEHYHRTKAWFGLELAGRYPGIVPQQLHNAVLVPLLHKFPSATIVVDRHSGLFPWAGGYEKSLVLAPCKRSTVDTKRWADRRKVRDWGSSLAKKDGLLDRYRATIRRAQHNKSRVFREWMIREGRPGRTHIDPHHYFTKAVYWDGWYQYYIRIPRGDRDGTFLELPPRPSYYEGVEVPGLGGGGEPDDESLGITGFLRRRIRIWTGSSSSNNGSV